MCNFPAEDIPMVIEARAISNSSKLDCENSRPVMIANVLGLLALLSTSRNDSSVCIMEESSVFISYDVEWVP